MQTQGKAQHVPLKKVKLKFHYEEGIRVVVVSEGDCLSKLKERLRGDYGFDVSLVYEDNDGDKILLGCENDLKELIYNEQGSVNVHVTKETSTEVLSQLTEGRGQPVQRNQGFFSNLAMESAVAALGTKGRNNTWRRGDDGPVRWLCGDVIGQGAFGVVNLGLNLDTGELMAVKGVRLKSGELSPGDVRQFENEVNILRDMKHDNIVTCFGVGKSETTLSIFLEYMPGGSVKRLLDNFEAFGENITKLYTSQLLRGLDFLHQNGVAHRDIKAANCLVDQRGFIKLADFGMSKRIVGISGTGNAGVQSVKGTPYWMAPEVLQEESLRYGWMKADVWSLGATALEMATGKPPWSDLGPMAAMFKISCTRDRPKISENMSKEGKDFLANCFLRDPNQRPTVAELLAHPWVTSAPSRVPQRHRGNRGPQVEFTTVPEAAKTQSDGLNRGTSMQVEQEVVNQCGQSFRLSRRCDGGGGAMGGSSGDAAAVAVASPTGPTTISTPERIAAPMQLLTTRPMPLSGVQRRRLARTGGECRGPKSAPVIESFSNTSGDSGGTRDNSPPWGECIKQEGRKRYSSSSDSPVRTGAQQAQYVQNMQLTDISRRQVGGQSSISLMSGGAPGVVHECTPSSSSSNSLGTVGSTGGVTLLERSPQGHQSGSSAGGDIETSRISKETSKREERNKSGKGFNVRAAEWKRKMQMKAQESNSTNYLSSNDITTSVSVLTMSPQRRNTSPTSTTAAFLDQDGTPTQGQTLQLQWPNQFHPQQHAHRAPTLYPQRTPLGGPGGGGGGGGQAYQYHQLGGVGGQRESPQGQNAQQEHSQPRFAAFESQQALDGTRPPNAAGATASCITGDCEHSSRAGSSISSEGQSRMANPCIGQEQARANALPFVVQSDKGVSAKSSISPTEDALWLIEQPSEEAFQERPRISVPKSGVIGEDFDDSSSPLTDSKLGMSFSTPVTCAPSSPPRSVSMSPQATDS